MSKCKASELLEGKPKRINTSTDFVYYQPALQQKFRKVSSTKIEKRPIYRCFIDYNGKYFPLRCMLDMGSTSFVISPEETKAFSIPVVNRPIRIKSWGVLGNHPKTENLFMVALGVSFRNHRPYNEEDHGFEIIWTSGDYDVLIPAWYLEKHQARGTTTSHLHIPHCQPECYTHRSIHPEYIVLAMGLDRHFGSTYGSESNRSQIGVPGHQ
jgi:hypothetical protein